LAGSALPGFAGPQESGSPLVSYWHHSDSWSTRKKPERFANIITKHHKSAQISKKPEISSHFRTSINGAVRQAIDESVKI
jgi:hypothetical protein